MIKNALLAILSILLISGCGIFPFANNSENTNTGSTTPDSSVIISTDRILNLSGKNLAKLDMAIFDKNDLLELDVSNNRLTGALPSQLGNLKRLKILKANGNQMTGVPAEIGQLSDLEILDLSDNQLTGLPNELANLKKLKVINLSGNKYSEQDLNIIRSSLPDVEFILK